MVKIFKAFKWIKPENSENLTKIQKLNKRASLNLTLKINRPSEQNSKTVQGPI